MKDQHKGAQSWHSTKTVTSHELDSSATLAALTKLKNTPKLSHQHISYSKDQFFICRLACPREKASGHLHMTTSCTEAIMKLGFSKNVWRDVTYDCAPS